jgi:O-antigen/teichoic acid export membrane protein
MLSHLLAPGEFGTAVAITVVIGLGSLVTDVALDRFVMLNNSAQALSTAHAISVVRGVLVALALAAAAPALAALFGVPNASESFAIAGCLSAIGGLAHLRIKQVLVNYDYSAEAIAQFAANIAAVLVLFPTANTLQDHRAIIISYAAEIGIYVILSHFLARTTYQMRPELPLCRNALSFGLPLMFNGIGLAVIYQFDRTLVGYWFGVKELASYAVILSVSVVPANLILAIFQNMGLSYLLSGNDLPIRPERYQLLIGFYALLATLYTFCMAITLDILVPLIFGASFTVSPTLHVLFIVIACLRLQRGGAPTTLLLAKGRTRLLASLNLSAGFGFLAACIGISIWPRLETMLFGVAFGELVAFTLSFALSDDLIKHRTKLLTDLFRTLVVPAFIVMTLAWNPELTWKSRTTVLYSGLIAIAAQSILELYRNKRPLFQA